MIQKDLAEEFEVAYGYVKELTKKNKKDYVIVNFGLSETPGAVIKKYFSGFNLHEFEDGQYVRFEYQVNGQYNNVKNILECKQTQVEPSDHDKHSYDARDDLLVQYTAMLNSAINICIKTNKLSDEEIKAQFARLINLKKLGKVFKSTEAFIKERYV